MKVTTRGGATAAGLLLAATLLLTMLTGCEEAVEQPSEESGPLLTTLRDRRKQNRPPQNQLTVQLASPAIRISNGLRHPARPATRCTSAPTRRLTAAS